MKNPRPCFMFLFFVLILVWFIQRVYYWEILNLVSPRYQKENINLTLISPINVLYIFDIQRVILLMLVHIKQNIFLLSRFSL
jgi:hypothetical protein